MEIGGKLPDPEGFVPLAPVAAVFVPKFENLAISRRVAPELLEKECHPPVPAMFAEFLGPFQCKWPSQIT